MFDIKEEFQKNGFVILKDFASHSLCDAIKEKAQKHFDRKIPPYETEEEYRERLNKGCGVF